MDKNEQLRAWLTAELTAIEKQHAALGEDLATLKARHEAIQITLQKMDELDSPDADNNAPGSIEAEALAQTADETDVDILTGQ